jgi:P-type Cu2+ transporter
MQAALDFSSFIRHRPDGTAEMELAVDGIKCAGCMAKIERAFANEPGVTQARVNLSLRRLTLGWDERRYDVAKALPALDALGFTGHPFAAIAPDSEEKRAEKRLLYCLGVAAFASMNIMLLSVSVWAGYGADIEPATRDFFHWISGLIALPAAAYAGRPFFESAWAALKRRAVNMDVPISLGILLALAMSVVQTLNHEEHVYFDSAIMLTFFLLIGRYAEMAMRRRTHDFATNLAALRAQTAWRLDAKGEANEVPIAMVRAGDHVLVRPGDRISVDGIVITGHSELDQSLVTGETAYHGVQAGMRVYAGSLNGAGLLTIRVTAVEEGTLLDDVHRMLSSAMDVRARYVRLADRAARLYAPMVHLTAALTFTGWMIAGLPWDQSLVIAITVLIITCPCALGLAVPAVQVVAAGGLFRKGVLLNGGEALERLGEADRVVFDKTGTLTLPRPDLVNASDIPHDVLTLAGRLALGSRHPLAKAIAAASGASHPLDGIHEEAGQGVSVRFNGMELRLGSAGFCDARTKTNAAALLYPTASLMAFRMGSDVHILAVRHNLRPDAVRVVGQIAALGLPIEILSGDREEAVADVARQLGITVFSGGISPQEKIARLETLKAQGHRVLMVGDGLNDAPALAAAHVSISPVTATEVSQAAADAVFLGDALQPVLDAITSGQRAKALMLQNLWFSVLYNLVAVPIAIAGLATPLVAALAMSGSSVIVTINAMRAAQETKPQNERLAAPRFSRTGEGTIA